MPKEDEMDLNGNSVAEETGQSEKTEPKEEKSEKKSGPKEEPKKEEPKEEKPKEEEPEEEDISKLPQWAQDKLKKEGEDKENYKKGMLKYKDLTLKKKDEKEEKKEEKEYPDWDEDSKKFQEQTLTKAEEKAESKAKAIIEESNEKSAIAQFISNNPGLAEKDKWNEIIENYSPANGKDTPADIIKDLNRALVLTRYESGEIDKIVADAKKEAKAEKNVADQSAVSKTTSKTVKGKDSLSKGAIRLAERMRVDTKKLAQEDDSSTAEIKL